MLTEEKHSQKYKILIFIFLILSSFFKLKNYIIIKLFTSNFSKDEYAIYSFILNTGFFLTLFTCGGILISISRYLPEYNKNSDQSNKNMYSNTIISTSFFTYLPLLSTFSLSFIILNYYISFIHLNNSIILLILSFFYAMFYGIYSIFNRYNIVKKKIKKIILYMCLYETISFIILLTGFFIFSNIFSLVICLIIGQLIAILYMLWDWKKIFQKIKYSKDYLKRILKVGFPKQFADASERIYYYILSILILNNLSNDYFADFSIANSIILLVIFVFSNIIMNYLPHISTLNALKNEMSKEKIKSDIKDTLNIFILTGVGGFILFLTLSKYLIKLIANPEYYSAIPIIFYLYGFYFIFYLTRIIGIGLFISEKTYLEFIISVISLLLSVIYAIISKDYFQEIGFLSSFLVFSILRFITIYCISSKYYRISFDFIFIIKLIIITILTLITYWILKHINLEIYSSLITLPFFIVLTFAFRLIRLSSFKEYFRIVLILIKGLGKR